MSVSRQFEAAARREINKTEKLRIRRLSDCVHSRNGGRECKTCPRIRFTDSGIGVSDYDDFEAIHSLMQMKRLKILDFEEVKDMGRFVHLIFQNSFTLETVTGIDRLPAPPGVCYPRLHSLTCRAFDESVVKACPRLENLQILEGSGGVDGVDGEVRIDSLRSLTAEDPAPAFLPENAPHIRELRMNGEFPVDLMTGVSLSSLEVLEGAILLDEDHLPCFPRLKVFEGAIEGSPAVLSHLPVQSMRSLTLDVSQPLDDEDVEPEEQAPESLDDLVRVVSRLVNLEKLDLTIGNHHWRPEYSEKFATMVARMTQLRSFKLQLHRISGQYPLNLNAMVQKLASGNQNLEELHVRGVILTNASLETLSHLTQLRDVCFSSCLLSAFTTDGILKLLKGGSKRVIRNIFLDKGLTVQRVDKKEVVSEYMRVLAGQGLIIDLRDGLLDDNGYLSMSPLLPQ